MGRDWFVHLRAVRALVAVLLTASSVATASAAELRVLSTRPQPELMGYINGELIPKFEAEHGVRVTFEFATWDERVDKLLISIAAGVPYDIVFTGFYSPYEEGSSGLLAPLDGYLERWGNFQRYPAPLWETQKWGGRIYTVPIEVQLRGVGYNVELFARAGLDPNAPPQSWDEILAYTRLLTHLGDGAAVVQRGFNVPTSGGGAAQNAWWWMRQAGITEIDAGGTRSNLDRPEALEALEFLVDLHEAALTDIPGAGGGLGGGRVAMASLTPDNYRNIIEADANMIGTIDVFAPRYDRSKEPVAHAFVNGLAITAASTQKDDAWRFIEALLDDDSLANIQRAMGWVSGRPDLIADLTAAYPGMDMFLEIMPYVYGSVIPPPRNVSQQEFATYLTRMFNRQISPQEALVQTHAIWNRLLGEWNAQLGLQQ